MEYHSQAMMRYNTIFTQTLITTLNTSLIAGAIIKINFAKITWSNNVIMMNKVVYMIKELCIFMKVKFFTKLKLLRTLRGRKIND